MVGRKTCCKELVSELMREEVQQSMQKHNLKKSSRGRRQEEGKKRKQKKERENEGHSETIGSYRVNPLF